MDGFFFKEEDIIQKLLCPYCKEMLKDARILPCGKTICSACLDMLCQSDFQINDFKCPLCDDMHQVKVYPINEILNSLLQIKPAEVYRNKSVEDLKYNLKKIQSKIDDFEETLKYPAEKINEYCRTIRTQIDLATEKAKQKLDLIHDDFFEQVKLYEELRHLQFADKHEQELNNKFQQVKRTIIDIRDFLTQNLNYLKEFKTDEAVIQKSIEDSKMKSNQLENEIDSFEFYLDFYPCQAESSIKTETLGQLLRTTYKTRRSLFGKNPLILKKIELPINDHDILSIDSIDDRKLFILSNYSKSKEANTIYLNVIDYDCTLMCQQQFNLEYLSFRNILDIKAYCSKERVLICSTIHNELNDTSHFDLCLYDANLKQLACRRKFDHTKEIVSVEIFDQKCYFLFSHSINQKFLAVYDDQLNEIFIKGKSALTVMDPFYFSSGITILKSNGFKLFLFDNINMQIQIMNQKTGMIEEKVSVESSEFAIIKSSLLVYKHPQKVIYFDLNGVKLTEIDLKGQAEFFQHAHFSNEQIICSTENFDQIIIFT